MRTTGKWLTAVLVALLYPMAAWLMGYSIERNVDAALAQMRESATPVPPAPRASLDAASSAALKAWGR